MDRFKFRAWDEGLGKLIYFNFDNIGRAIDSTEIKEYIEQGNLMQCTGLKDKNGNLIYEGDIVVYDDFSNGAFVSFSGKDIQPKSKAIIKIDNLFEGVKTLCGSGFIECQKDTEKKLEIIGNVYENKSLLERKE